MKFSDACFQMSSLGGPNARGWWDLAIRESGIISDHIVNDLKFAMEDLEELETSLEDIFASDGRTWRTRNEERVFGGMRPLHELRALWIV